MRSQRLRNSIVFGGLFIALAMGVGVTSAHARDGRLLQVGPDRIATIVQIDIGSERWSIVFDEDRGTIIGNVFRLDGGASSFVFCRVVGETRATDSEFMLDCQGADACLEETCPGVRGDGTPDWQSLGTLRIPATLLRPPGGKSPVGRQTRFCGDGPVTDECSWELEDEATCAAAGGCWEQGLAQWRCVCPTTDAGRPCEPGADSCQGYCEGVIPSGDFSDCREAETGVCSEAGFSQCACTRAGGGFATLCE